MTPKRGGGSRRAHRRKASLSEDPLVDVNADVLRWAVQDLGLTVSDVARRAGVRQQTVDAIYRDHKPNRKVRRSLLQKLAAALEVPGAWVGKRLPSLHLPGVFEGTEFAVTNKTRSLTYWLADRVAKAVKRDLRRAGIDPKSSSGMQATQWAQVGIVRLVEIGRWRARWIRWPVASWTERHWCEPPLKPTREETESHEAAVLHLLRAVLHILDPWFRGHAELDYASLRNDGWLWLGPVLRPPLAEFPSDPLAILPTEASRADHA